MAIIGTIRDKGRYVLVGIIGIALLLFIAQSFFDNPGGSGDRGNLGTIDGDLVDQNLYAENVTAATNEDKAQAQQQQREYGERETTQSEDKAWQMTVEQLVMQREYDALGVSVSDKEFNDYLFGERGFTLMSDVQQQYTDPLTGKFKSQEFEKFLSDQDKLAGEEGANWKKTKDRIRKARTQEKYNQILNQGIYVTKLEAKQDYLAKNTIKSISFVVRNYRDIPDEDVKITEAEIKDFYERNKEKKEYEVLAGRNIRYFDIALEPSKADIRSFNDTMAKLKNEFAITKNDSLYILAKSDFKFYRSNHQATFRPQGDQKAQQGLTYPQELDTVFKTATIGQIVGPYDDNGTKRIAKVMDFNTNVMKVRHILISAPKGDNAKIAKAKIKADSILNVVNKDNFTEFVTKFSEDQASIEKGGVYEDFMDYEMVEPFADFAVEKPIGTIGIAQTEFGFHIIEVLDRKTVRFPVLAVVQRTLVPSETTKSNTTAKAAGLLAKITYKTSLKSDPLAKLKVFDTIAKKAEYYSRDLTLLEEAPKVNGFQTKMAENALLKLAFDPEAEVGDLCGSPIFDKDRYVIAMLTSIREKGVPTLEDCYTKMRVEAIKEKKANRFKKEIGKERNLEKLAKKGKTTVMKADVTFANPSIQGAGYEPEIVGSLFSNLADKKTTLPLVGKTGVYVIHLNKTIKAPAAKGYDTERDALLAQLKGQAAGQARQALMKKLEVTDNRRLSEVGIAR
jgi:peptidyl-prolyl cis-trans isomerase D